MSLSDLKQGSVFQALKSTPGLNDVERLMRSKFASESKLLSEIPEYLMDLGGKRIRPVLTLVAARALGMSTPSRELIEVAAGIELIHMATLLHDDIIDCSPLRRHKESPFLKYGSTNSLLCGDFLLVRAFSLCAHLDSFIIDETERACIELTEGEIEEIPLHKKTGSLKDSLDIARKKTASLFRLCAASASHLAANYKPATDALSSFGENLGIAFQILDDILDVVSDEATLGKKAGIDIHERKPSIVNVFWLEENTPLSRELLKAPEGTEEEYIAQAIAELRSSRAVQKARALASDYAAKARAALHEGARLCPKPIHEDSLRLLEALIDFTLARMQ